MWRELSPEEEDKFRLWAQENYTPHTEINSLWHPVVKDECELINSQTRVVRSS